MNYSEGVNVRQFGVVGDMLTDDTAALQNAIDASAAEGWMLLGNVGDVYRTSGPLRPKDNLDLNLRGGTIFGNFAINGQASVIGPVSLVSRLNCVKIRNGTLRKQNNAQAGRLITLLADDMRLDNLTGYVSRNGFMFIGGDRARVTDCRGLDPFDGVGCPGIRVVAGYDGRIERCYMEAGDDAYALSTAVPSASPPNGTIDKPIGRWHLIDNGGYSIRARMLCIAMENPESNGGMTASVPDVTINGLKGSSADRAIVIYNTDSIGSVSRVDFNNVDIKIGSVALSVPPIKIAGVHAYVEDVTFRSTIIRGGWSKTVQLVQNTRNIDTSGIVWR